MKLSFDTVNDLLGRLEERLVCSYDSIQGSLGICTFYFMAKDIISEEAFEAAIEFYKRSGRNLPFPKRNMPSHSELLALCKECFEQMENKS